ncbi:MAG: hypothetical protein P8Z80_12000 [Pseudolabrys sp.]
MKHNRRPLSAILAAAAVITLLATPSEKVAAGPMPAADAAAAAMHACASRPWPYLNCVGTLYGDPKIRLVGAKFVPGY